MTFYFSWALIIVSIVLIGLVLLQTRGGGLGSIFGGDGTRSWALVFRAKTASSVINNRFVMEKGSREEFWKLRMLTHERD